MNDEILSSSTRCSYSAMRFDLRVAVKVFTQCLVDRLVHPVFGLPVAVALVVAVLASVNFRKSSMPFQISRRARCLRRPSRCTPCGRQPESGIGKRFSAFAGSGALASSAALHGCRRRHLLIAIMSAISMMPRLIPCNSSPGSCDLEQQEQVDHRMDGRFGLADADRLDEDHVEPGRFAQDDRSRAFCAPRRRAILPTGEGRMKTDGLCTKLLHAGLVAEDRAAAAFRTGVDRQHRRACGPVMRPCSPTASIKVDFPAPGTPVMPMRTELPPYGRQRSMISCACA